MVANAHDEHERAARLTQDGNCYTCTGAWLLLRLGSGEGLC